MLFHFPCLARFPENFCEFLLRSCLGILDTQMDWIVGEVCKVREENSERCAELSVCGLSDLNIWHGFIG